ncbi:ubiquinone anaerobic biosynthesis accessory factor UbiT [Silvimonas soli]|uniref:ubiquinone anaerobic biosynthesis accessory factor UbiT n=1 Tax=Silvimonas soli TaxID=2980100 RepID=UPI0024B38BD1|nr:SCP2 sterol-binding domain-containing protein [Silvimonas soli]
MLNFFTTLPRKVLPRLPEAPPALVAGFVLNRLAPRLWADDDFSWLNGQTIRIAIRDLGCGLTLTHNGRRFAASNAPASVTLAANWRDLAALMRHEADPDTLFFQRKLLIEGDTELGLHLKNRLDATDWDALYQSLPKPIARWLTPGHLAS